MHTRLFRKEIYLLHTMSSIDKNNQLEKIGAVSGIISIVLYISAAAFSFLPDAVSRICGFTFPLLWIISFMGLYSFLNKNSDAPTLKIAYVFGVIGAAIACCLVVVQQANIMWHNEALKTATTDEVEELLKAAYRGANRVQAGLDVAFDIFITISWILFGLNIARSPYFPRLLGWSGSLIALILLVLNMYTFPNGPAYAGLIDVGPFLGLWALIFFVWFAKIVFK